MQVLSSVLAFSFLCVPIATSQQQACPEGGCESIVDDSSGEAWHTDPNWYMAIRLSGTEGPGLCVKTPGSACFQEEPCEPFANLQYQASLLYCDIDM